MAVYKLTALICKEDDMYVARCPEVSTVSQGHTEEEALENLKEATELYLEDETLPQPQSCSVRELRVAVA